MKILQYIISVSVLVLFLITGCDSNPFNSGSGQSVDIQGITVWWKVSESNLEVEVTAETTGWVAVGFDSGYMMENANIIVGYVHDNTAYVRDDFGTAQNVHQSDSELGGQQNTSNIGGTEKDGETSISFTIPLDSGDLWDKKLENGSTYQIVVMHGPDGSDDFSTGYEEIHNGSITI